MTIAKQSKSQGSFDSLTDPISSDELALFDPDETSLRNGQTTDLVRLYLQDIGRVPLLERDEELTEARKVQNYIQLLEKRQGGADAGDAVLAEFLKCINIHDRLAIELGCRPPISRWAQEMGLDRDVLRENIRQGKQRWADLVGLTVKELDSVLKAGAKAKEHMIQANLRLVVSVAKKYQNRGLELLDLIQEGTLGLERAVDKFDPTKGYRFSTYAYWWIRQGITRAIATQSRTIRLPVHVTEKLNKIKKAQRQISQTQGCTPSIEDVAQSLDMTAEQVREVLQKVPRSVSLEIRVGKDRDTELGDLLETQDASPEENLVRESLQRDLENLLTELTDREREVIQLRYGLGDGKTYSLAEIGRMLELSRERVRQIEAKALQKLRQPKRRNMMRDYLDTLS
ncbi:group 2 sigma factor [[Synechococcus] sp. NIES-970]|uniref:RNA polymerase sigma factor SigC n=1 Tax=Picosynechococcus sp. NKBG15041c TaxID=1407650 RepID=UPI0004052C5A|nr:RNA polymerase sigma factor SigC [Picosynechococcus sp. NKBG15041c]BAW96235.1 group 2 sigma factor [[Synechococcus] sp. NIES-970]